MTSHTRVPHASSCAHAASRMRAASAADGGSGCGARCRGFLATSAGLDRIHSHRTAARQRSTENPVNLPDRGRRHRRAAVRRALDDRAAGRRAVVRLRARPAGRAAVADHATLVLRGRPVVDGRLTVAAAGPAAAQVGVELLQQPRRHLRLSARRRGPGGWSAGCSRDSPLASTPRPHESAARRPAPRRGLRSSWCCGPRRPAQATGYGCARPRPGRSSSPAGTSAAR